MCGMTLDEGPGEGVLFTHLGEERENCSSRDQRNKDSLTNG